MRLITLAAVALSAVAGTIPSSVMASPPTSGPPGRPCSYSATSDPSPEAGEDSMTGQINAGPVVGEPGGELICTLQVNNELHSGADTVVRSSGPADSTGVSIVAAADVAYVSPEEAQDYLCTSYRYLDGTELYYHPHDTRGDLDPTNDIPGHWTRSPHKPCGRATQFSTRPFFEAADALAFCPALQAAHNTMGFAHREPDPINDEFYIDHEGDVFVNDGTGITEASAESQWWFDCPVYIEDGADAADIASVPLPGAANQGLPAIIDW